MHPQDLEPEMEELLARLVPDLANEWQGATPDEIDRIEQLAGRPLPRFYRWFLLRMGHSMGPIAYRSLDFSAPTVLSCYAEQVFVPHPRFFMIGYETDEMMPLHMLYDFNHPARDDARVAKRHSMGGDVHNGFDTFREKMAWGKVMMHSIETRAQRCVGSFRDRGGDVLLHLDPVMKSLGFETPIPTGSHCSVYVRSDASMNSRASLGEAPQFHVFQIGAVDPGRIRRILGEIATETSLEVEIDEWDPRL